MKKNVLYYKSKWGATKQYAEWIDEVVADLELKELDDFNSEDIKSYHKVVIGSRTYRGKIEAEDFLIENWQFLKHKSVYLFSVGIEPPEAEGSIRTYERIPKEIREGLAGYVKLMGKLDREKITFWQKLILRKFKPDYVDHMEKVSVEPIVSFLKGFEWEFDKQYMHYSN